MQNERGLVMDQNVFHSLLQHPVTYMPRNDGILSDSLSLSGSQQLISRCANNTNSVQAPLQEVPSENCPPNKKKKNNHPKSTAAEVITAEEHELSIKNSPAYYLGLFIDSGVINWLIQETATHSSHLKNFQPVSEEEMRCFIAVLYLSGYVDVPRRRMLWERAPDTHCPVVSNAMQRDRFESIFAALHQPDALKDDSARFLRLRPLIDQLNERFLRHAPREDQHSIAECVIPTNNRHHPSKGAKSAIKVWCACTKSGYCVWFDPCQGQNFLRSHCIQESNCQEIKTCQSQTLQGSNHQGKTCSRLECQGINCQKANFQGSDSHKSKCRTTNFQGFNSNCSETRICQAESFQGPNHQGKTCSRMGCQGTNCQEGNFQGSDRHKSIFRTTNFQGSDCHGSNCQKTRICQVQNFQQSNYQEKTCSTLNCQGIVCQESDSQGTSCQVRNCQETNSQGKKISQAQTTLGSNSLGRICIGSNCQIRNFEGTNCQESNCRGIKAYQAEHFLGSNYQELNCDRRKEYQVENFLEPNYQGKSCTKLHYQGTNCHEPNSGGIKNFLGSTYHEKSFLSPNNLGTSSQGVKICQSRLLLGPNRKTSCQGPNCKDSNCQDSSCRGAKTCQTQNLRGLNCQGANCEVTNCSGITCKNRLFQGQSLDKLSQVYVGQSIILNYASLLQRYRMSNYCLLFESCYSEMSLVCELQRLGVQGSGADRDKSGCLLNPALGGVDRMESNVGLYRISIRGKKCYSALITYVLDVALHNAWQLYKITETERNERTEKGEKNEKKQLDLLGFRRNVVIYYLQHYAKPILGHRGGRPTKIRPRGKRPPPSDARFDGIRHYVIPQEKQTRCAKCTAKTTTRCQKCDVGVHVKCFVEYHQRPREITEQ